MCSAPSETGEVSEMYRIYIQYRDVRLWLLDWIVSVGMDHPQFTTSWDCAMTFERFGAALEYHGRLKALGYEPHIA